MNVDAPGVPAVQWVGAPQLFQPGPNQGHGMPYTEVVLTGDARVFEEICRIEDQASFN